MTDTSNTLEGPGAMLAAARESRGWEQKDICDRINLNLNHVKNLESDNYEKLPPTTFVMGYIRSYATLLDLDPEPFIKRFREKTSVAPPVQVALAEDREPGPLDQLNLQMIALAVACIVILSALVWWMLGDSADDIKSLSPGEQSDQLAESASGESSEFLPDEALFKDTPEKSASINSESDNAPNDDNASIDSISYKAPDIQNIADKPASAAAVSDSDVTELTNDSNSKIKKTDVRVEPELNEQLIEQSGSSVRSSATKTSNIKASAGIALPPEDVLLLKALEDSWVSVTDADSVRLMYGVLTSGTPRKLEGIAPFSMVFGAASGIEVTLNGEPVDFSPMIRKSKTARFLIRADGTLERQSQDD